MGASARKTQTVESKIHALVREKKVLGNTGINMRDLASQQWNL